MVSLFVAFRSIYDALCVVKRTLESKTLVPGGGACEAALSIYLETFATSLGSREQLAIAEYAKSLLVIPKCLAVNAGKEARVQSEYKIQLLIPSVLEFRMLKVHCFRPPPPL